MIPATLSASLAKEGYAKSKWLLGGLHHPSVVRAQFAGHRLVPVTMIDPASAIHHFVLSPPLSMSHLISKQAPQVSALLNRAGLRAVVSVPYPVL